MLSAVVETRRDPGIPNDWPFKAALLSEIEKQKAAQAAIDATKRAERKERQQERKANPATFYDETALPASLTSTAVTTAPVDPFTVRSRQTLRLLRQLVQQSQLILFCLDARDPMGSRWHQLESKLAATPHAPPLVFVLTHCDTVPAEAVDGWVRRLSGEYVTVAFVSDRELDDKDRKPTVTTDKKLKHHTTDALIQLVHSYRPDTADDSGTQPRAAEVLVNVAVMGFENTGKSSVVNALMRAHWCGVSGHSGYTKDVQVVRLGERVRLHDSPGVPSLPTHPGPHITLPLDKARETGQSTQAEQCVRAPLMYCCTFAYTCHRRARARSLHLAPTHTCTTALHSRTQLNLSMSHLLPCVLSVMALVDALDPAMVMSAFRCATFTSADDFLSALATKQGKFAKGGAPNTVSAARALIRQWNEGAVPHYTTPPQLDDAGEEKEAGEGQDSGLGGMFRVANDAMLAELREREESGHDDKKYIVLEESLFAEEEGEDDDEDEEMDEDDDEAAEDDDDEENEEQDGADEEDEQAESTETVDDEQAEAMEMDEREEDEEALVVKPSPVRTRSGRAPRSPTLSISTQKTKQQPLLTPSRAQQTNEKRRRANEDKDEAVDEKADAEPIESIIEANEEQVSEPDSPAKNTRSHRKKAGAPAAPPVVAVTTPRRSARARSSGSDQQAMSDIGSVTRTRARRK